MYICDACRYLQCICTLYISIYYDMTENKYNKYRVPDNFQLSLDRVVQTRSVKDK